MEWTDQRTGAGPQGWCVAKYSQMLTALGHSPDILRETERPGGGQWSQEPEQKPSSTLFAFTVDQVPHDKTRSHEKKVRVTTLGLGALPAGLKTGAVEEAELQQAMLPCPPLPSPALPHPPALPMQAVDSTPALMDKKQIPCQNRAAQILANVTFSTSHAFSKDRDEFFSKLPLVVESGVRSLAPLGRPGPIRITRTCTAQAVNTRGKVSLR